MILQVFAVQRLFHEAVEQRFAVSFSVIRECADCLDQRQDPEPHTYWIH